MIPYKLSDTPDDCSGHSGSNSAYNSSSNSSEVFLLKWFLSQQNLEKKEEENQSEGEGEDEEKKKKAGEEEGESDVAEEYNEEEFEEVRSLETCLSPTLCVPIRLGISQLFSVSAASGQSEQRSLISDAL